MTETITQATYMLDNMHALMTETELMLDVLDAMRDEVEDGATADDYSRERDAFRAHTDAGVTLWLAHLHAEGKTEGDSARYQLICERMSEHFPGL